MQSGHSRCYNAPVTTRKFTILVVEDDADLVAGLQFALGQDGYTTVTASTVSVASSVLAESWIDLVILDVTLPDGNGTDLCRQIRDGEFSLSPTSTPASVPVMFLTARDDEIDVVRGLEIGGDDYVAKPFRLRELLSRVKARLRHAPTTAGGIQDDSRFVLTCGDLKIDSGRAEVTRANTIVQLTAGEYRLLLTLARHRGQVLTRSQLTDRALALDGGFTDDNTISVYIRRLREKIEVDPSAPRRIVTVRGVGYRFETT
jgi:DNA-binding response OmpR family regulator